MERETKQEKKQDDRPPVVRVQAKNGIAYYPKFKKGTNGEWELLDKSFSQMPVAQPTSEKQPVRKVE